MKNPSFESPEIEFHYLAIANELGLVENPTIAFSRLLVNPKIRTIPGLEGEILAALASTAQKLPGELPQSTWLSGVASGTSTHNVISASGTGIPAEKPMDAAASSTSQ